MDDLIKALESLVDQSSIEDVLACLSNVCLLKAEHVRTNWQDENTAKYWEFISTRLIHLMDEK